MTFKAGQTASEAYAKAVLEARKLRSRAVAHSRSAARGQLHLAQLYSMRGILDQAKANLAALKQHPGITTQAQRDHDATYVAATAFDELIAAITELRDAIAVQATDESDTAGDDVPGPGEPGAVILTREQASPIKAKYDALIATIEV